MVILEKLEFSYQLAAFNNQDAVSPEIIVTKPQDILLFSNLVVFLEWVNAY